MNSRLIDARAETNPLFRDNRLKLGVFGVNVSGGCAITTAPEALEMTWPNTLGIVRTADEAGFEAAISVGRWRGFGGDSNFNGTCFETYTWAAGVGQATREIATFTTSHIRTVSPVMAAKEATTIDHITGGRYALNIVCGAHGAEMDMFGLPYLEHDDVYDYAAEWIEIMQLLWTREEEFDYEGKYLHVKRGFSMPKPIQQPFPALMNAGGSQKGHEFMAKYVDIGFISASEDFDETKARAAALRDRARSEYGRDIQIWVNAFVAVGDSDEEAWDYVNRYVLELGDDVAVEGLMADHGMTRERMGAERFEQVKFRFKAGWGGLPLVGTADHVVDRLDRLASIGVDGLCLSWLDYRQGLDTWCEKIMPRLVQAGLRREHTK